MSDAATVFLIGCATGAVCMTLVIGALFALLMLERRP